MRKRTHFQGFEIENEELTLNFDDSRLENAKIHIENRQFVEQLNKTLNPNEFNVCKDLKDFVFKQNDIKNLSASSLILLTHKFREIGDSRAIIELYNECDNNDFTNSPVGIENVANAHCNIGNLDKSIEMCQKLAEQKENHNLLRYNIEGTAWYMKHAAARLLLDVEKNGSSSQKKIAAKKYLKNFPEDTELQAVKKNLKNARLKSLILFQKGFTQNMDSFSGLRAAMLYAEMGDIKRSKKFAEMTMLVCERDGGLEVADYQRTEIMSLALALSSAPKEHVDKFIDRLQETPATEDQRRKTLQKMLYIREQLKPFSANTLFVDSFILKFPVIKPKDVIDSISHSDTNKNEYTLIHSKHDKKDYQLASNTYTETHERLKNTKINRKAFYALKQEKAAKDFSNEELLRKKTFGYRGLPGGFITSSSIAGNFDYNGQVSDHSVSRVDFEQFTKLLDTPIEEIVDDSRLKNLTIKSCKTLHSIEDPNLFSSVVDQIIRSALSTDERGLETLNNKEFDSYVNSVTHLAGIGKIDGKEIATEKKGADSKTSITSALAIGLGDCRHHAQIKQLLCDTWQREKMTKNLREALFAIIANDDSAYYTAHNDFIKNLSTEFRTMDMTIHADVKERKIKDGDSFIKGDGIAKQLEQHTGNIRLDYDINFINGLLYKKLTSIALCDAMYQNIFNLNTAKIPLEALTRSDKGNVIIPVGELNVNNPQTGKTMQVPLTIEPVFFAENLDPCKAHELDRSSPERLRQDYTDTGDTMDLCGLTIEKIDLPNTLIKAKKMRAQQTDKGRYHPWLKKVRSWVKDKEISIFLRATNQQGHRAF